MRKRSIFTIAISFALVIMITCIFNCIFTTTAVVAQSQPINSTLSSTATALPLKAIFKQVENSNINGCYDGSVSGGQRATCREQGDINSVVTGHNYAIYATVVLGQKSPSPKDSGTPNTEITSGGPGSREGNCCGITVGVHNDDGTPYIATEDWTGPSGEHTYLCDDSGRNGVGPCVSPTGSGPIPGGKNGIYGQTVNLQWHVQRVGNNVTYTGVANSKQFSVTNPTQFGTKGGSIIYPQQFIHVGKKGAAPDSSRLRVDGARKNVQTGTPQVFLE